MAKKKRMSKILIIILIIIIGFGVWGYFAPQELSNIALIEIKGVISSEGDYFTEPSVDKVISDLQDAESRLNIKAIVLKINSPGGSPVGSEDIVKQIKKSNKLVVSYIRDAGASGAYWIASASDYIFASPISIVGSVGVNAAYLEFSGLLARYNVTYVRMNAGQYKDIGSPLRALTLDEEDRLRQKIEAMHEYFLDDVAESRHLNKEQKNEIKNADFYLGSQAKELGLIDEFGGEDEAIGYVESKLSIKANILEYIEQPGLLQMFSNLMSDQSFMIGKGIGSMIFDGGISLR